ncbi:ABC transporter family substrate-binding protein [Micropruina sonneratiae]|uniref:ABC transporter family substrate-binding protein n=1 Tax=Micropruina sonneratiae TaxID=2986940 RepID=UPI0022267AB7|nr:ABC transporter family substrate-binding protein [Micropruina sp. KQZ13P-5]MCW3156809.1 ABC transporter family substrate-binding protein [Micropruina sp. KQZ13P-5]
MGTKKWLAGAAVVVSGALALSACTPTPAATQSGAPQASVATVAWNQAFYSANSATTFGNATANNNILYMANDSFNYYDKDLKLVQNTSFGAYEKTSDDPLTVKQTIADTAMWSDGVPVSPADLILSYAAQSGLWNTYTAESDDEGNVDENKGSKVFFNSSSIGYALIKKFPTVEGNTVTYEYSKPYVDWEVNLMNPGVPAHVVGKRALGIDDPTEAANAVLKAFQDKDNASLTKISNVWNLDFNFKNMPADKELVLGTGPYTITDLKEEQYVTLTKNPNYKGEHVPSIDTITVRIIPDPQASVQALQNGEVLATQPQATADILQQMQALQGVTVLNGVGATFEHVDMAQNNKGPFDPASYGGDADKALKVRQAFLHTVPRQQIIDNIIKPLNPDAAIRNSLTVVPGAPDYDAVVAANGMESTYGAGPDIDTAKKLLSEAGVSSPKVRFLYASNNTRRQQEFQLIKESAEKAGFVIEDVGNENWGAMLSDTSKYDASLFGWQSTNTGVTNSDANFRTKATNNFYGYSSKTVDGILDQLAVELDTAKQTQLVGDLEKQLVDDAFSLSIFQFPEPTAVSNRLQNLSSIQLAPTMFWNFWEWKLS